MTHSPNSDGMNYAPQGKPRPVVRPGEFTFAAAFLEHGHIYGQCNGLIEAGAQLKWVYDEDPKKVEAFAARYPQVQVARSFEEILDDSKVHLVAAAAVPNLRGPIGVRVMDAGKDYFTDKTPFTLLEQLDAAKAAVARTKRKYMVYFSERLHVESAMFATDLVAGGVIGRVLQVIGLGPHRLNKPSRPAWFWEWKKFGGILCDIGSHQFEQFLTFSGATDATVSHAAIANYANRDHPEFEDFGEASLLGNNAATNYVRVDWFTPDGLETWGDTRLTVLGTEGFIEVRKNCDIAGRPGSNHVFLVDGKATRYIESADVELPFGRLFIADILNRTETAMTQAHCFLASELALRAQTQARQLGG